MIPTKSATGPLTANDQDLVFTTHHETKAKKKKKKRIQNLLMFSFCFSKKHFFAVRTMVWEKKML